MRKHYDFSGSVKNPYAKALKGKKLVVHLVRRHRTAKASRSRPAPAKG
jgi:hypothetical protein